MDACDDLVREFTEFVDTVVTANIAPFKNFCTGYLIGYLVSNVLLLLFGSRDSYGR